MHSSKQFSGVPLRRACDQIEYLSGTKAVGKLQTIVRVVCPMDASHQPSYLNRQTAQEVQMAATAGKVSAEARNCDLQKMEALFGGVRVLSCRLNSALDAHELLLSGLPTSALNHLLGHLVFIDRTELLEKAVGMSLRTLQRHKVCRHQ